MALLISKSMQQALKKDLEERKITAFSIKEGKEQNPYPIGIRNLYRLYRTGQVSARQYLSMSKFLTGKNDFQYPYNYVLQEK